jgi:hypothetical protein
VDPNLTKMFGVVLASGAAGMIVGAVYGYFSGDQRLRVGNSSGIGFLIGAAIGATIAVFQSMLGRI